MRARPFHVSLMLLLASIITSCSSVPETDSATFIIENVLTEKDSLVYNKLTSPDLSLYETFMNEKFSIEEREYFKTQISDKNQIMLKPVVEASGKLKKLTFIESFDGIYDKTIYEISYPLFSEDKTKVLIEVKATELKRPGDPDGPLLGTFVLVLYEWKEGKWVVTESDAIDIE